jgi:hypothetical protein
MALKGRFFPRNPHKYLGNPQNIVFRSAWERTFMEYCDTQQSILQWASEEMTVPYYFTGDSKWHRYYPDFVVNVITKDNERQTWMVEIKPSKQVAPPVTRSRGGNQRRYLREAVEYARNQAKWTAARAFCANKGWKFVIITEKDLYPNAR